MGVLVRNLTANEGMRISGGLLDGEIDVIVSSVQGTGSNKRVSLDVSGDLEVEVNLSRVQGGETDYPLAREVNVGICKPSNYEAPDSARICFSAPREYDFDRIER